MALVYKMRAIAVSDSSYVFWTDSEPDLDGTNAPEPIVADTAIILSVGGTAEGGGAVASITPHDTTHSPEVLYNFASGSRFTDSSGNGRDLQASSGTVLYANVLGLPMVSCRSGNVYRNTNDAALELTGAVTIEAIVVPPMPYNTSDDMILVSFNATGNNILWDARLEKSTGYWTSLTQSSSGTDDKPSTTAAEAGIQHFVETRASDGVSVKFYVNGVQVDSVTHDNAPSGPAGQSVRIGSNPINSVRWLGLIGSVKVIADELTASEVAAEYNRTLGPLLGEI